MEYPFHYTTFSCDTNPKEWSVCVKMNTPVFAPVWVEVVERANVVGTDTDKVWGDRIKQIPTKFNIMEYGRLLPVRTTLLDEFTYTTDAEDGKLVVDDVRNLRLSAQCIRNVFKPYNSVRFRCEVVHSGTTEAPENVMSDSFVVQEAPDGFIGGMAPGYNVCSLYPGGKACIDVWCVLSTQGALPDCPQFSPADIFCRPNGSIDTLLKTFIPSSGYSVRVTSTSCWDSEDLVQYYVSPDEMMVGPTKTKKQPYVPEILLSNKIIRIDTPI